MRYTSREESRMTKEKRANNMVWFELPVSDLGRATAFYETIFATKLKTDASWPELAMFPKSAETATTGALIQVPREKLIGFPSADGTVVYLNCDGQLDAVLHRTTVAGGKVLEEVAQLPGSMGFVAQISDLDGNRVGLHAIF
jgi:predicted enzyme related to lactoylglutathione lyase